MIFKGFGRQENPCFFQGFLVFLAKKKQGLEDQGCLTGALRKRHIEVLSAGVL